MLEAMAPTAFMDAGHVPTQAEIARALGSSASLWERLTRYVADTYRIEPTFIRPTKSYGWEVKFRKGGRTLLSLTPDESAFTALVVLGVAETDKAAGLDLGEHVRRVFAEAEQLRDGRWLFIRVESERDIDDIEALLAVKRRPAGARAPARTSRP